MFIKIKKPETKYSDTIAGTNFDATTPILLIPPNVIIPIMKADAIPIVRFIYNRESSKKLLATNSSSLIICVN